MVKYQQANWKIELNKLNLRWNFSSGSAKRSTDPLPRCHLLWYQWRFTVLSIVDSKEKTPESKLPSATMAPSMKGNFQGKVVLFACKVEYFIYTGKCSDWRMVACFRNNCDIFIDQLPVSITKITTGREDRKTVVTEVCALNFTLLFVHMIFSAVNVQQNFSRFQVFFQVIVCSMLLSFYGNMDSHFFFKQCY